MTHEETRRGRRDSPFAASSDVSERASTHVSPLSPLRLSALGGRGGPGCRNAAVCRASTSYSRQPSPRRERTRRVGAG